MELQYKQLTIEQVEYLQERIDEVMDNFNFNKVETVMELLKWGWGADGKLVVPDKNELRKFVRSGMRRTYLEVISGKNKSGFATGGFKIICSVDENDGVIYFTVEFILEHWCTD